MQKFHLTAPARAVNIEILILEYIDRQTALSRPGAKRQKNTQFTVVYADLRYRAGLAYYFLDRV
jgi:hypothetical protein